MMTLAQFRESQVLAAGRKSKRLAKRALIAPKPGQICPRTRRKPPNKGQAILPIHRAIKRGAIKTQIVRLLGLLDAKKNGKNCRLDVFCPAWSKIGPHNGDRAYHLTPQQRGDAARFVPENVVWACNAANCGEYYNRALYREKHLARFGKDLVERLEAIARTTADYSMADLLELRTKLRMELGEVA